MLYIARIPSICWGANP